MTECISNRLCYRYRSANGAMLTFGKTGFRTGCSHACVGDLCMAKSIHNGLCYSHGVTNRAVLTFGKTGFRTGSCYSGIRYYGMSGGRLLCIGGVVASGTGHVGIPTDFGTGGSFCVVTYIIMTKCINHGLCYGHGVTNGTVFSFSKTGVRTSRAHSGIGYFRMSGCRNNLLNNKGLIARRAMLAFGKAFLGACCSNRLVDYFGMIKRCLCSERGIVTSVTSNVCFPSGFSASRRLCLMVYFIVSKCVNNRLCYGYSATSGAMLTLSKTGFCTGRSYSSICHFGMTERVSNRLCYTYRATCGAMLTFGKTGFCTGRSFRGIRYFGMTECIDLSLRYRHSITNRTVLTFSKTGFRTSRCYSSIRYLGMSGGRLVCISRVVASGTSVVSIPSTLGTSRHFCLMVYFIVSKRVSNRLCYSHSITNGAMLTFGKTGFRTGCRYGCICDLCMAKGRDCCLLYNYSVTNGTVLTFSKTGFRTGCCYGVVNYFGMTQRGNLLLCSYNFITRRAFCSFG